MLVGARTHRTAVAAAAVFAVGAATDGLDGYLARRFGTKTAAGQWLDPLADKLLVVAAVVALVAVDRFPLWAVVVIVVRETALVVIRAVEGARGRGMPASFPAKVKTVLQLTAITLYLLPLGPAWEAPRLVTLVAAVVFTVATGFDYVGHVFGWWGRRAPAGPAGTPGP